MIHAQHSAHTAIAWVLMRMELRRSWTRPLVHSCWLVCLSESWQRLRDWKRCCHCQSCLIPCWGEFHTHLLLRRQFFASRFYEHKRCIGRSVSSLAFTQRKNDVKSWWHCTPAVLNVSKTKNIRWKTSARSSLSIPASLMCASYKTGYTSESRNSGTSPIPDVFQRRVSSSIELSSKMVSIN